MFFDIETVPDFEKQEHFTQKYPDEPMTWLLAEFGKIICISCGFAHDDWVGIEFKTKSFSWADEKQIVLDFLSAIDKKSFDKLCWFNIVNFDIPFVFKRALVHGLKIPRILSTYDEQNWGSKKPREMSSLDLMLVWKSTGSKNTSLDIVCKTLGIESPKQDHDWSQVAEMYTMWKFAEIEKYCEGDVIACYEIYKKIKVSL
jgi:predicted PolB exonuclease-like 3'-5' exonuclease